MHEITGKEFKIEDSNVTFESIYAKSYFPGDIPGIKEANVLLIPDENLRENTGITFPESTDEFFNFLRSNASEVFKPEIAVSDGDFQAFVMHSASVSLATMICNSTVFSILKSLVANFLYDLGKRYLRKPAELSVDWTVYVQDAPDKSKMLKYRGSVEGLREILNHGMVTAFGGITVEAASEIDGKEE